jgi:hypothetical protein
MNLNVLILILIIYFSLIIKIIYIFFFSPDYKKCFKEDFQQEIKTNIIFLNEDELFTTLSDNKDNYYNKFFSQDFIVRNTNSTTEYINKNIKSAVCSYTKEEQDILTKYINDINNILLTKPIFQLSYFDGKKAVKELQWKLGCVQNNLYENGLPHTRNDIIIFPKSYLTTYPENYLKKTLLHEFIHIYQKFYPNDVEKYLQENNITKYRKIEKKDNIRANPDTDDYIYYNEKNQTVYKAVFHNNSKSISDVTYYPINDRLYEHPFEMMAIKISDEILKLI